MSNDTLKLKKDINKNKTNFYYKYIQFDSINPWRSTLSSKDEIDPIAFFMTFGSIFFKAIFNPSF